jgi:bifunctional ADP-heptose synthase (sugar kinase/adenylyltransferase)
MVLFEGKRAPVSIPIFGADECTDVTGAGDTVVATASLALASGASALSAAWLANIAGGLVVMKMGTATVSLEEMQSGIEALFG